MANLVAHLPDLTIPSFPHDEREQRLRAARRFDRSAQPDVGGQRPTAVDDEAAGEALERVPIGNAAHAHFVLTLDSVARVRQPRRQLAVAREDQEPLGIVVEPPHRIDVVANTLLRDEIDHRGPVLRIGATRDVASRFVQKKVETACGSLDPTTIDAHVVDVRVRLGAELGDGVTVDAHPPFGDERLGGPP